MELHCLGIEDYILFFPVEYKKGKPKITDEDKLQLTAQAMCLEEMFSTMISEGALFLWRNEKKREYHIFTGTA